jgi:hypothetical protein
VALTLGGKHDIAASGLVFDTTGRPAVTHSVLYDPLAKVRTLECALDREPRFDLAKPVVTTPVLGNGAISVHYPTDKQDVGGRELGCGIVVGNAATGPGRRG